MVGPPISSRTAPRAPESRGESFEGRSVHPPGRLRVVSLNFGFRPIGVIGARYRVETCGVAKLRDNCHTEARDSRSPARGAPQPSVAVIFTRCIPVPCQAGIVRQAFCDGQAALPRPEDGPEAVIEVVAVALDDRSPGDVVT